MPDELQEDYGRFDADGADEVRRKLITGVYGERRARNAEAWLGEVERFEDDRRQADEIADRREALRIAKQSNKISVAAFFAALIAILISLSAR